MSVLQQEIEAIRAREIPLAGPYPVPDSSANVLRMVFLFPYGHPYSLLCNGPMSLYELINRTPDVPAVAERALQYDCLLPDGNRLTVPGGEPYRSIESPFPVHEADIVGVSVTNSGDLHSVLRLLDLAGIPRRTADRIPGKHPLVVGGNGGLANPEVLADYLDIVALGEAEHSLTELIRTLHTHRTTPQPADAPRASLLENLARIPGLYVPSLYACDLMPGGGVSAIRPRALTVPPSVHAQALQVKDLHPAHFTYPITDGTAAGLHPVLGCLHSCDFCTLGTPPFRQAPLDMLTGYIDRLEELQVPTIIISAPTFTQYRARAALLAHIKTYADRAATTGKTVTTIIGSVRADELSADYLDAVNELGDFGHLFTELSLDDARGIITIAPEWANPELVALYGKTQKPERVNRAIDLCRTSKHVNTVMLYFIVGAPGEQPEDRLAIANYAKGVRERLGRPDGSVIVKIHQFMPEPGTPAQRLEMTDPALIDGYVDQIREHLAYLVGQQEYDAHYRVLYGESNRLYLEAICLRGDRRVGHVLEDLFDQGADLTALTRDELLTAMDKHGLDFARHLRHMDDPILPWHIVNSVPPQAEQRLITALARHTATA
ncbi:B12-binding domain-containing radical SAM protein [Streptomyces sp. SID1121]|uniref:B12-binding domain-containing radical SAM protein n=1 Tax=Streptomyces sp. SID1121 TaxID=3425888 RepID=UPI004056B41C